MLLRNWNAGVQFLKRVPHGTYDAIILDAFHVMGTYLTIPHCAYVQFTYGGTSILKTCKLTCSGSGVQGPAEKNILESVARALRPGGVMSAPAESMWHKSFSLEALTADCRQIFKGSVNYAWTIVPSYSRHPPFPLLPLLIFMGFVCKLTPVNLSFSAGLSDSCFVPRRDHPSTSSTR